MKNILVTGGLGYIGSHTVVALQQAGFNVFIIDDLSNTNINVWEKITEITNIQPIFYNIDLKDYNAVSVFFQSHKIDGVIHFAAYKAVGESVTKPLMYYRNNLVGLINVLQAMEEHDANNFIFSSSCTVYGQADEMPIHEKTPLKKPESPYGNTKKMGEEIIEDFVNATNKNAIALRYFNPVGSNINGTLGDLQPIPTNLVPYILQIAIGNKSKLNVFGNDYNTKDGTAIRDYIDVNDLADAHVKAIQRLLLNQNKTKIEYFNLGSGTGSTVLEIVQAFENANHIKIPFEIKPRRAGDIEQAYADYSLAQKELNWCPKTPLQKSMQTAWNFQKQLTEI